jgi:hypothetical protein
MWCRVCGRSFPPHSPFWFLSCPSLFLLNAFLPSPLSNFTSPSPSHFDSLQSWPASFCLTVLFMLAFLHHSLVFLNPQIQTLPPSLPPSLPLQPLRRLLTLIHLLNRATHRLQRLPRHHGTHPRRCCCCCSSPRSWPSLLHPLLALR